MIYSCIYFYTHTMCKGPIHLSHVSLCCIIIIYENYSIIIDICINTIELIITLMINHNQS